MTTFDGYPLARQGLANVALSISAWASFVGSTIAVCGIVLLAPLLADWALAFGPAEYFLLMVFAFCALTSLLGDEPVKGILAAMVGLFIATVGVDANSGVYRYTFDLPNLADGIDFVVVVIGLFAVAEMLQMLESLLSGTSIEVPKSDRKLFNLKELALTWWTVVRSGVTGLPLAYFQARAPVWLLLSPMPTKRNTPRPAIPKQSSVRVTSVAWLPLNQPTTVRQRVLSSPC